jgi:hypothetical protein
MNQAQQDSFKWFGEGFTGFPKQLPESCVEYVIYLVNSKLQDAQIREHLRIIQKTANELSKALLTDYIWQRDDFNLELERKDGLWLLRGQSNVGDSTADEWLIVYLLREISQKHQDAWVRIYDSDGEFLIWEAAKGVPKWIQRLNPNELENRVWIHNAEILLIPLHQLSEEGKTAATTSKVVSLRHALGFIASNAEELIHSPLMQEEAFTRIRNYPEKIRNSLHNALVTIPRKLAFILHRKPAYISPAIDAFYLRDPISMRVLKSPGSQSLHFPPGDLVTMSVRFNRVGYAQIDGQHFQIPAFWESQIVRPDNPSTKSMDVGIKLTCGFEMLLADPQKKDNKAAREILYLLEDIESGEDELPSDQDIEQWSHQQDDESWMNIDFADFERELSGKAEAPTDGFGDRAAQDHLRKIARNLEKSMGEQSGIEGVVESDEEDDTQNSDDESEISDTSANDTDDFDKEKFLSMMQRTLGVFSDETGNPESLNRKEVAEAFAKLAEFEPKWDYAGSASEGSDDEDEEIEKLSRHMEAELNEKGAFDVEEVLHKFNQNPRHLSGNENSQQPIGKGKSKEKEKRPSSSKTAAAFASLYNDEDDSDEQGVNAYDRDLALRMLQMMKGHEGVEYPSTITPSRIVEQDSSDDEDMPELVEKST